MKTRVIGVTVHGESKPRTREYIAWFHMNQRCSPNYEKKEYYYERGISVEYKPWRTSYVKFRAYVLKHLGRCPPGHTLDRIDNARGYFPGNIRWATRKEQANNRGKRRW